MYENIYNSLTQYISDTDITETEQQELLNSSKKISPEQQEIFYFLIYYHYRVKSNSTKTIYPYKLKQTTINTIDIDIDQLPFDLKHILLKFIKTSID